jgi:hypothetical protein
MRFRLVFPALALSTVWLASCGNDAGIGSPDPCRCPDLVVSSIAHDTPGSAGGNSVTVIAFIRNQGATIAAPCLAQVFCDQSLRADSVSVPSLGPAAVAIVRRPLGPVGGGSHTVRVCVDPQGVVGEASEENNCLDAWLELPAPPRPLKLPVPPDLGDVDFGTTDPIGLEAEQLVDARLAESAQWATCVRAAFREANDLEPLLSERRWLFTTEAGDCLGEASSDWGRGWVFLFPAPDPTNWKVYTWSGVDGEASVSGPRRESRVYARWHVSEDGASGSWEFYQEPVASSVWLGTLEYSCDCQGMQTLAFGKITGQQWVVTVTADGTRGTMESTRCAGWIPCHPIPDQVAWENGHGTWFHGYTDMVVPREW